MNYLLIKRISHGFTALLAIALVSTAEARGFGELGLLLASSRIEDQTAGGGASSARHFHFDIATGWQAQIADEQLLSYGIVFNSRRGFQADAEISGYGVGAFVGWYLGSLSLRLDYIFLAELKSHNGINETQFLEGAGFNVEARWLHWFEGTDKDVKSRKFAVGPALAFKQMNFSKSRIGSLPEVSANRKIEEIVPGLRGVFIF